MSVLATFQKTRECVKISPSRLYILPGCLSK
nr:MAG TPA: hypothetical protein [Caudoviricetes sp.]